MAKLPSKYDGSVAPEDMIEYTQRLRVDIVQEKIANNTLDDSEGSLILLGQLSDTAIKQKRLEIANKEVEQAGANAAMIQEALMMVGNNNPLMGGNGGRVFDAEISDVDVELDPDNLERGNKRITLDQTTIDPKDL